MIGSAHNHDRAEPLLIAPARKYRAFILSAGYVRGNLLDIHNPQRPQLSNISGGLIFVWHTATGELSFNGIGVGKDCDSRGHAAVNETGSFKHCGSIAFARNDNNVSRPDALINNEHPPSGPQNRLSNRRHSNAGNDQQHGHQRESTSQPTSNHCLDDI